jgi:hypothetical protein
MEMRLLLQRNVLTTAGSKFERTQHALPFTPLLQSMKKRILMLPHDLIRNTGGVPFYGRIFDRLQASVSMFHFLSYSQKQQKVFLFFFFLLFSYIVWRRAREPILPVSGYSY